MVRSIVYGLGLSWHRLLLAHNCSHHLSETGDIVKILDMSAGGRAIWLEKDCDLVTFLDRREETKPTFVCDTR